MREYVIFADKDAEGGGGRKTGKGGEREVGSEKEFAFRLQPAFQVTFFNLLFHSEEGVD